MNDELQPGELVVRRIRWGVDAQQLGLVIGRSSDSEWLVMWMIDSAIRFKLHNPDALMVVNDDNLPQVGKRRCLST